jgi:hypothetical protein
MRSATTVVGVATAVLVTLGIATVGVSTLMSSPGSASTGGLAHPAGKVAPPDALRVHGRTLPSGVPRRFVGQAQSVAASFGVYETATGQRVAAIGRASHDDPLALSGDGRSMFVSGPKGPHGHCTSRVNLATGRLHRLAFCATGLAVSSDGRMIAYTTLSRNDLTVRLVIRSRATGRHRTLLLYRNCKGCNNAITGAELAWAPDDDHLAISIAYTESIQTLQVMRPWRGSVTHAPFVMRCNGIGRTCERPAYDRQGRLLFTRFGPDFRFCEVRRSGHRVTALRCFSNLAGFDLFVVDSSGNAFMWQASDSHGRHARTDLWTRGHTYRLFGDTRSRAVIPILWG